MTVKDELDRIRAETPGEEEEAADAEEAEATPETPDEDDDQTAPPALPAVDPDALEKESKRHERAMAKVLGPAWGATMPCEACGALGYVPSDFEPPPKLEEHPTLVTCRTCNGYGVLATPSKNPQYGTEPCTKCAGTGYVDKAVYEREQPPAVPQPFAGAQQQPPPAQWNSALGAYVDHRGALLTPPVTPAPYAPNGPAAP